MRVPKSRPKKYYSFFSIVYVHISGSQRPIFCQILRGPSQRSASGNLRMACWWCHGGASWQSGKDSEICSTCPTEMGSSMDFNGLQRTSMDFKGFQRISIDFMPFTCSFFGRKNVKTWRGEADLRPCLSGTRGMNQTWDLRVEKSWKQGAKQSQGAEHELQRASTREGAWGTRTSWGLEGEAVEGSPWCRGPFEGDFLFDSTMFQRESKLWLHHLHRYFLSKSQVVSKVILPQAQGIPRLYLCTSFPHQASCQGNTWDPSGYGLTFETCRPTGSWWLWVFIKRPPWDHSPELCPVPIWHLSQKPPSQTPINSLPSPYKTLRKQ